MTTQVAGWTGTDSEGHIRETPTRKAAGSVVWWNAADVKIHADTLRGALDGLGLADVVPAQCSPVSAMRRAMSRRQGALGSGWRWEVLGSENGGLILALVAGTPDLTARDWRAQARKVVEVDRDGTLRGDTLMSCEPNSPEHTAMLQLFARYDLERSQLTQSDVREAVLDLVLEKCRGVRIKTQGGLYFVPAPHDETITKATPAFAPAGLVLRRLAVTGSAVSEIARDARAALLEDIAELATEGERRLAALAEGKGTRDGTIESRLQDIDLLNHKISIMAACFQEDMDEVAVALASAQSLLLQARKTRGGK